MNTFAYLDSLKCRKYKLERRLFYPISTKHQNAINREIRKIDNTLSFFTHIKSMGKMLQHWSSIFLERSI